MEARTLLSTSNNTLEQPGTESQPVAISMAAAQVDEFIYLSDLNWTSATSPYSGIKKDLSSGGNPLTIGGISYTKGLGVHSPSSITYNLNAQYTRFTAYVGIDDSVGNSPSHGSAQFLVYVDEELKHTSSRRDGSQGPEFIDVDLTGAQTLRLVTNTGGNPGDNDYKDHANWADARLYTTPAIPKPAVSITAATGQVDENGAPARGSFLISRDGDTTEPLTVHYSVGGSATPGSDYASLSGSVTIPAGQVSVTVFVDPIDDSTYEGDETVVLTLTPTNDYTIAGPNTATITIVEDDPEPVRPTVTVAATDAQAGEPDDTGTFTLTRDGDTTEPLIVYFTVGGTAVSGKDYVSLGSTITIPAGESSATLTVTPIDDTVFEGTKQVVLTLAAGEYNIGEGNSAVITLTDDDPEPPTITVEAIDAVGAEAGAGTEDSDDIVFRLSRSGDATEPLDVDVRFTGDATLGQDFIVSGPAHFAAGASETLITVQPIDDDIFEGNETLTIEILPSQDSRYAVGYLDNASAVIIDNDAPRTGLGSGLKGEYFDNRDFTNKIFERIDPVIDFAWSQGSPDPRMGADTFSIRWTGQIEATDTERYTFYTLSDDGVRLWVDGQLLIDRFFDQGAQTEWSGSIDLVAGRKYDIKLEYYENVVGAKVRLSWSSPSRPKEVIPAKHLYTLPLAGVTASDDTAHEAGDPGAFTFTLAFPRSEPTVMQYVLSGTATLGQDFTLPGSIIIPAGEMSHTVPVLPVDDDLPEGLETITLTLIDTSDYFVGPNASATINLLDNESGPAPAPRITEPAFDDFSFSAFDVHMVIDHWADPNEPDRPHLSTDWEIWTTGPAAERVWYAHGQTDPTLKVHIHLGDGTFDNSHAGQDRLNFETSYVLRVRVHSTGPTPELATSPWATRPFSTRAEITPIPNAPDWTVSEPGYEVQVVATGLTLPTKIAFVPEHLRGDHPSDPSFYVIELYGAVKVITNSGHVFTYASELLNYSPFGGFPGSGEQGAGGITVDPKTGDVIVALVHDQPNDGGNAIIPAVIRLKSTDGGLTASSIETIISMPNDPVGPSHQISEVNYGPDGKLYVHIGDGNNWRTAQDLDSFRGKIIRLNDDGTAPEDNPFYDASDGITARDYVFAYGFRNPFGGAFRESDGMLYEVENGPQVDRFAQVRPGENYGWDNTNASMSIGALYNWPLPYAPAGLAFIEPTVFGGSGFESRFYGHAFVAETGPTYATGPQGLGKRITRFNIDENGNLIGGRNQFVAYSGTGKATVADVAAGPDGLYFVDLYRDTPVDGSYNPVASGARVLRVVYTGVSE